jgi:hypothetical protein
LYTEVSNFERAVVEGFCRHPHIREVLKAEREQLALLKHVSVPEPTQYEHATAIVTGQEIDKALEASEECIRAPLSAGFREQVAGRSTSPRPPKKYEGEMVQWRSVLYKSCTNKDK